MLKIEELLQLFLCRLLQIDFPKIDNNIWVHGENGISRDIGLIH